MSPDSSRRRTLVELVPFSLLSLLFCWPLWLGVIASESGLLPFAVRPNPFGSFAPFVAALVCCAFRGGRDSVRRFLRSIVAVRLDAISWVAALVVPTLLPLAAVAVSAFRDGPMPAPANLERWYLAPGVFLLVLVLGGPLGEEPGWRGYALPKLLAAFRPIEATAIVAALWLLWHLPLFWMPGSSQQGIPIWAFGLVLWSYAAMLTWLWRRTESTAVAIGFHAAANTAFFLIENVLAGVLSRPSFAPAFLGLALAMGLIATWADERGSTMPNIEAKPRTIELEPL